MSSVIQKPKYLAYLRKSTVGDEMQALSIESQREKIQQCFPNLNLEFIEEKQSAFKPYGRPVFSDMLKRLGNDEAYGIVAWHPDRLSRNEIDAAAISFMIREGQIKDLKFASYPFQNTPEGIWMLQMALSQSQYDSAKKGRDVKRGMEKKRSMGWKTGVAPTGYINTPEIDKGLRIIKRDPERFEMIRKMWDLMLTGRYSCLQILNMANQEWGFRTLKRRKMGGASLKRTTIYRIFTNRFYAGWLEFPRGSGNWEKAKHDPMVTDEEFDRVQILLGKKGKPAPRTRSFPFTGLLRCGECGAGVTAEEKHQLICSECKHKFAYQNRTDCRNCHTPITDMKNPTVLKFTYYHCTGKKGPCSQTSINAKRLEGDISAYLSDIQISQKYLDWALRHLRKAHELESASRETVYESQEKRYREVTTQLDGLLDMRMAKEITDLEYAAKKAKLVDEQKRYGELLKDTEARQHKWLDLSERAFMFACYARFWFENGSLEQKRDILTSLGSNLILKDKKLTIEAAEPFSIIQKGRSEAPDAFVRIEPEIQSSINAKREPVDSLCSRWLPIVNAVRTYYLEVSPSQRDTHPIFCLPVNA